VGKQHGALDTEGAFLLRRYRISPRLNHTEARTTMIARIWRGTVREADKDIYYEYLQKTGLKEYADTPGNRGVHTLRRVGDGKCEFFLLTLWDSWEAIKAFAGPDYEKAVYYPEDDKYLVDRGPKVDHYEVLES
jgi:heme-degrading monooxygenase HmoA